MIRNLKTLGLALMAVFALGAVSASAASAGALTTDGPVTLKATETGEVTANRLTAFGAFIQCPESTYAGHAVGGGFIPSGATTITLTPEYKQTTAGGAPNCIGPFGWSATVETNNCDYVVHVGAKTGSPADTYGGTIDVVCPAGKEITVRIWTSESDHTSKPTEPFCILHVPPQTGLKGADATDTTNGTIDVTGTVEGIRVLRTAQAADPSPVLCATSETTTGKFDIDTTVTGKNEAGGATTISLSGS